MYRDFTRLIQCAAQKHRIIAMADDSESYLSLDVINGDEYEGIDDVDSEDEEQDGEEKSENAANSKKGTRKSKHIFPSKNNPVPCKVCNTLFTRADALKSHEATHTGKKPFICKVPFCGKAYLKARYLREHKRSHTVEKFDCKLCNMEFASKHELSQHVRGVHDMKKLYKCEACGKSYMKSRYLNEHKRICKERKTVDEATSKE